jgi:hypothetical protein
MAISFYSKQEKGGDYMAYEHTNSKGVKYFLHNKGKLLFFSKKPEESIDLPAGMEVTENTRTGLPMVRKKQ